MSLVVWTILVGAMLAAPGALPASAQAPAPGVTAKPAERKDLRDQIYVMEGALARAVEFGAQRLNREIRSVVPEMVVLSGVPEARGVYLEGYGVFFNVSVPVLHQSMVWSLRMMLDRDDKGLREALAALKAHAKTVADAAARNALENAIARLELQVAPLSPSARPRPGAAPRPLQGVVAAGGVGAAMMPPETAVGASLPQPAVSAVPPASASAAASSTAEASPQPINRMYLQDPNRAYTASVQRALIDVMIDFSAPMALGPDEWLTVAARDNERRDSLAPLNPYDEVVTILYRIKGADLAAYRAGQIDREETRRRVQVRQF